VNDVVGHLRGFDRLERVQAYVKGDGFKDNTALA